MTASTILVTGGTGTLGRRLVPLLHDAGHRVRVLSRRRQAGLAPDGVELVNGDLARDVGLDAAIAQVDTIVHLGGSAKGDEVKTGNLVHAATRGGTRPHLVYISVVGADRVPVTSAVDRAVFGYYTAKLASERLVVESGLPWTTLRATQFHDSIFTLLQGMARLPVIPVFRGVRFQPVDTEEVAQRLAELVPAPPAGLVPDLAGPHAYGMDELARSYLATAGRHRPVVGIPIPGGAARAVRAGALLALGPPTGRRSWEEFLAERQAQEVARR